jgi:putative endonuclease
VPHKEEKMEKAFVYILTNKHRTTLYTGVKSNLRQRIKQHKDQAIPGFTKRFNIDRLVYYETHQSIEDAIYREKRIKKGTKSRKLSLIREMNPDWKDLYLDL